VPCGIVFRSVGYRGVELPGVPFDEGRGTIPNEGGRVRPGLYVAGWIKRGPSGVIGTNKKDATESVELVLEDARAGVLPEGSGEDLEELLRERGADHIMYAGWEAIDATERAAGEPSGRPRVKLCTWDELLEAARAQPKAR
jgi:ferredoxin/flavodoxin---NADP+ reductase